MRGIGSFRFDLGAIYYLMKKIYIKELSNIKMTMMK